MHFSSSFFSPSGYALPLQSSLNPCFAVVVGNWCRESALLLAEEIQLILSQVRQALNVKRDLLLEQTFISYMKGAGIKLSITLSFPGS